MRRALILPFCALGLTAGIAEGFELPPGSNLAFEDSATAGALTIPLGAFADGALATDRLEGKITRRSWHVPLADEPALPLFQTVRDQLIAAEYRLVFECDTVGCGGFDFRHGIEVLEAPAMFVDLGAFHFASFTGPGSDQRSTLLVSKGGGTGYVQLLERQTGDTAPVATATTPGEDGLLASNLSLAEKLDAAGATILDDLEFATGAAELTAGPFETLAQLAAFLQERPSAQVALVGHTDAEGSLEGNVALSKRRAEAVRDRLVAEHGVAADQILADGVGFLSPRASNLDAEGRRLNRRVEVVLVADGRE